ncbi:hypothetical protein HPB49_017358 [Dermacentor silvarum]|uniref:Uncharacterized protein n=1 Tax=Dermacentor silvarum TaxID=543639 RepID=A0ACB8DE44_DERSI|nr:hypothetical protein HPB49_017358 [Dermacentor silvarum]
MVTNKASPLETLRKPNSHYGTAKGKRAVGRPLQRSTVVAFGRILRFRAATMSEQLKFIVQELNKEPFNKKLNLISFDAFRPDQLLQALNDVFAELDPKMKADVRSEDPEQLAMKNLAFLRILKYKPPPDIAGRGSFRQGLVSGAKEAVLPVLEWTLRGLPELRKRAYLGRFLVRVELPPELDGDVDLQALYAQVYATCCNTGAALAWLMKAAAARFPCRTKLTR